jgi:hypothetical protein
MADVEQIFSRVPVRFDGCERGSDEVGIFVFEIKTATGPLWFEVDYEFASNGNDFHIVVSNFGLLRKSLAGSRIPSHRREFTSREIESATDRIRDYFSDSEEKDFFPFNTGKGRFIGVRFTPGWAVLKLTCYDGGAE